VSKISSRSSSSELSSEISDLPRDKRDELFSLLFREDFISLLLLMVLLLSSLGRRPKLDLLEEARLFWLERRK